MACDKIFKCEHFYKFMQMVSKIMHTLRKRISKLEGRLNCYHQNFPTWH